MKLLPKTPRAAQQRDTTEDAVGLGIEAAVIIALFLGLGYLIDRLAGTMPVFMIVMTVLGAIGLFAKLKYRYDDKMDELDSQRRAAATSKAATNLAGPNTVRADRDVP